MKFNFAAICTFINLTSAAALPTAEQDNEASSPAVLEARKAPCALHAHYEKNWADGGYRRYRVRVSAENNDSGEFDSSPFKMIDKWCDLFYKQKDDWYSEMWNAQCWNDGATEGAADISVFIGEYGWNQYKSLHQETVNAWREWTEFKCDVDSGPW